MGIFSLFGKHTRRPDQAKTQNTGASKVPGKASGKGVNPDSPGPEPGWETTRAATLNSTALKIDAIESAMSSEFVYPTTILASLPLAPDGMSAGVVLVSPENTPVAMDSRSGTIQVLSSNMPAVVEQAALLFASAQSELAAELLEQAIDEDNLGGATASVWWMLLDLYRIDNKHQQFDDLSEQFAQKFENSPPAWDEQLTLNPDTDLKINAGAIPAICFPAHLDTTIIKYLERCEKLALLQPTLRLEFIRVKSVEAVACGQLLQMLKKLQESETELIVTGSIPLEQAIRTIVMPGRRDDSASAWLLLLEILRLRNNEQAFDDVSIDYCVTFEVSPPPFMAPKDRVLLPHEGVEHHDSLAHHGPKQRIHFLMPVLIEGRIAPLTLQIESFAGSHNPALINCSRLIRIDFNAAGQLMNALLPLVAQGRKIEFYEVNHLVVALLKAMGLQEIILISARKN